MSGSSQKQVRVRFAPSPTGPLHVGNVRSALFNWLFARKHGGVFVLRVEDTDKERSEKKYEDELLAGLAWLGLDYDEGPTRKGAYGPYRQSERTEIYKKYLKRLMENGNAYYCYCTKDDIEAQRQSMLSQGLVPKYSGHCRNLTAPPAGRNPNVIRFKVPEVKVEFTDLVRGKVVFDAGLFGDIIIAKDLDTPLYNFAVVVDDALMEITHVIRAEDHLSNTPKQILMQKALGLPEPIYAHVPLILNADRSKMSKRFSDTALSSYRERGYLPDAMVNFLAFLGWHPKDNQEVMSREQLIKEFDIDRVQRAGAVFNEEKLDWLNREHMKTMSPADVVTLARPFFDKKNISVTDEKLLMKVISVELGRSKTLDDFAEMSRFFFALPDYESELLIWKEAPADEVASALKEAVVTLRELSPGDFHPEILSSSLSLLIGKRNRGVVLWPLRVALSGQAASPDPVEIMEVLGKEESLRRIEVAIQKLA